MKTESIEFLFAAALFIGTAWAADDFPKPYSAPCVERENVFEFTEKPAVRFHGADKYEITFAVKGHCDVTIGIIDDKGVVVRHLGAGVLGSNAPDPFQKNSLKQKVYWNGQDDLKEYVKEPERLRVQVRLGLKPAFDKLLGWHTHDVNGGYWALGADKDGVYVGSGGDVNGRARVRRYDHDGNYVKTLFPPAADVPKEKLVGLQTLEVEPERRELHVNIEHFDMLNDKGGLRPGFLTGTVSGSGVWLPPGSPPLPQQPCLLNGWFIYANTGYLNGPTWLFGIRAADGAPGPQTGYAMNRISRRKEGFSGGMDAAEFNNSHLCLAASPDGHWIYVAGLGLGNSGKASPHAVYRLDAKTFAPLDKPFAGEEKKPGADNAHFNGPEGVDCDAQGRLWVCDSLNNRLQVFAEDGKFLKSVPLQNPFRVQCDRKRGTVYVAHRASVEGMSVWRLSRLQGFDDPKPTAQHDFGGSDPRHDGVEEPLLTLNYWMEKPRLWLTPKNSCLKILEDRGTDFVVVRNFTEDLKKAGLETGMMNARFAKVSADPKREQLYYYRECGWGRVLRHDLKTAKSKPVWAGGEGDFGPDRTFDKRGLMFVHVTGAVYRYDPDQPKLVVLPGGGREEKLTEVPFDYGTFGPNNGGLELKDQGGPKGFQDGIGVNMLGEVAVVSNIYYVPKFEESNRELSGTNFGAGDPNIGYNSFMRKILDRIKKGEEVYYVKRWPGRRLAGGTLWVYDKTGELRSEDLVPGAGLVNGVQLDEQGAVYLIANCPKLAGGKTFLRGRGAVIGGGKGRTDPFTGTLLKATAKGARLTSLRAQLKPDPAPDRPPELAANGYDSQNPDGWVDGAEWLYAGASPIVPLGCSCANMRHSMDWYKRSFVPEAYRHSVGILDANGNLLLHLGRYGNSDSGRGPDSPVKIGGDEIAFCHAPYVTATDNHLCVSDIGNERLVVLKLNYHAEETVPVVNK